MVKANAYGHGAVACARALQPAADGFAVAIFEEAQALREAGIEKPILVLEGLFEASELPIAHALQLWLVVHHEAQLRMIETAPSQVRGLKVWLKIDTGMHRAGFAPEQVRGVYQRLIDSGRVTDVVFMSHFSCADESHKPHTLQQIKCFDAATAGLPGEHSLANSAGILGWADARRQWARSGVMLYGVEPGDTPEPELQAVMTLSSQIMAVRELPSGQPVGYGAGYITDSVRRIGLVCVGYADGYPRDAITGTPVAVGGQLTQVVGRVSMDMLTVDITGMDVDIGTAVELWGKQVPVAQVAAAAGRSPYEVLCSLRRVPVHYESGVAAE